MSNSVKRILTAVIAVPVIYIIILLGGLLYLLFILGIILFSQLEYREILRSRQIPNGVSGTVFSVLTGISAYIGFITMNLVFTLSVLVILVLCLRGNERVDALRKMGGTIFGLVYIGLLLSHAILLRDLQEIRVIDNYALNNQGLSDPGFFFVVFAVACTFIHDTAAYYTGVMAGRHKLAPGISPGKTIEGTIGGFIACIITGLVVNFLFGDPLSSDWTVALAIIISFAAILGDLVESAIKRGAGLKDSGFIVPGHGGVLDRFDSLIFVFPVTYYIALVYYKLNGVWL